MSDETSTPEPVNEIPEAEDPQPSKNRGAGIGIGIGLGVAFGVAFDNIAIGIALGIALSPALGALASKIDKK